MTEWKDIHKEQPPFKKKVLVRLVKDNDPRYYEDRYGSNGIWRAVIDSEVTHWTELPEKTSKMREMLRLYDNCVFDSDLVKLLGMIIDKLEES